MLSLKRPHWETRVWIDGRCAGTNISLSTPHEYDLGLLDPGRHVLTIRVDNRMIIDVGLNSHGVSDHTQGNWNGVVGHVALSSTPLVWIEDVELMPEFDRGHFRGLVRIGNATGRDGAGRLRWKRAPASRGAAALEDTAAGDAAIEWTAAPLSEATISIPFGAARWDEFAPNLIDVEIALEAADGSADVRRIRTGVRELATKGTQFTINGRPAFLRGTLECCIFTKTGHPPTDVAEWKRILNVAKAHGLNLFRFHSWCPPEAAFAAADEVGFYYHVEAAVWANSSTTIGDGQPVDAFVLAETEGS